MEIDISKIEFYKNKYLRFEYPDGRSHVSFFLRVSDIGGGKSLVFRLDRKDKWKGVEIFAEIPNDQVKIYVNE